jgi:hypothetical protein
MKPKETLHDCPKCGRKNFTARGLAAHACKGAALALPEASDDALMGEQLTAQYKLATSGMQQVVIFGAMMLKLREKHPETAKKGPAPKSSSNVELPKITLRGWLEIHAPEVKLTTALRFLNVTEAIAENYQEIVGAKTAKLISLPDLVTTPSAELPKGCEAKQLELFDFVNGTSQRSWLDRFSPVSPQQRGRDARGNDKPRPPTAAELAAQATNEITDLLNLLDAWFEAGHHTRVDADLRMTAEATLEEARKKLKAVK